MTAAVLALPYQEQQTHRPAPNSPDYVFPIVMFESSNKKVVGEAMRAACGYALPLTAGTKAAVSGGLKYTSQHKEFRETNNIGVCGCGLFDIDDIIGKHGVDSEEGSRAIGVFETLIRIGEHIGDEFPECPIDLSGSGAGFHFWFRPVPEWETTDGVVVNGCDKIDVGCGHLSPTGTFSKFYVCAPSTLTKRGSTYRWLCREMDPLKAFLEHTGIPSYDDIPLWVRPSIDAAVRWAKSPFDWELKSLPPAVVNAMLEPSESGNPVKRAGLKEERKGNGTARASVFSEFPARRKVVLDLLDLHEKAAKLKSGDLSPLNDRARWLAFCAFVTNEQNWDYSDDALTLLIRTVRVGSEDEDEEQIRKDFRSESFPHDNNIITTAANISRWALSLEEELKHPAEMAERKRLEEAGLHIIRFGARGNQAVDVKSMTQKFEGGARPSDSYLAMGVSGLKNYNFLGDKMLAMSEMANISPCSKSDPTWSDRLKAGSEHYLSYPTDYSSLNLFPVGVGQFARDPTKHIPVSNLSFNCTYRGIKYGEDDWPDNPLKNDDLRIWIECLKWWANDREKLHWTLSWCAHEIQNPWERLVASLVIGGHTRSGKTALFQALMACKTTGGAVVLLKRFTDKFNKVLTGLSFLAIDEVEDAQRYAAYLKFIVDSATITIEPKGVDAHDIINMLSILYLTNREDPGLVNNGGGGRYTVLFNFDPVVEDVGDLIPLTYTMNDIIKFAGDNAALRQALFAQRVKTLALGDKGMPAERQKAFLCALTAYLARYECCDVTSCINTDSKDDARQAETESHNKENKVSVLIDLLYKSAKKDDICEDGILRWLPASLYSLASEAAMHNKYVDEFAPPNVGESPRPKKIPMQVSLLMDIMKLIRSTSSNHYIQDAAGDKTTINNMSGRLKQVTRGGLNTRAAPVVYVENVRNIDHNGAEVKCVHIAHGFMTTCREDSQ